MFERCCVKLFTLTVLLTLLALTPSALAAHPTRQVSPNAPAQDFAGGTGTEADPYLVETAEHLNNVRNYLDAHFRQTADINLGVAPWNEGEGWSPIGTSGTGNTFTGSFDGAGYTLHNLTINRPTTTGQGLFGYVADATLSDLSLRDVDIQAASISGGLAASLKDSAVENVTITGAVISSLIESYTAIGGLAGEMSGSALHHIAISATVQGRTTVGGLLGRTGSGGAIRHAYTLGSVQGGEHTVGGLVGYLGEGVPIVSSSYSRASVSGTDYVGGLVGRNYTGAVYRAYSTGAVTGTGENVGGLLGSSGNRTGDCYWDIETSGQTESAGSDGVSGKTTAQMQQQATYEHYNFRTLWAIDEGNDYPVFQDLSAYTSPQPVDVSDLEGTGVPEDPYLITTVDELNAMRQDLSAAYQLGNDIDLAATVIWNYGRGWEPTGAWGTGNTFTGSFDGAGYTLHNLTINRPTTTGQGLFGYVADATLSDLSLRDVDIQAASISGGLAASLKDSAVENVTITGAVISSLIESYTAIGGLAGEMSGSALHHIAISATVQGRTTVGGLLGRTGDGVGEIRYAYTQGSIVGELNSVGGLVGYLGGALTISDSYGRASVSGADYVGGLIGNNLVGTIHHAYSTGVVTGTGEHVGGFMGGGGQNTANCYWDTETSGLDTSAGGEGVSARTTAQMTYPYPVDTYVDWDFDTIWGKDIDATRNDGYPYLQTPVPSVVPTVALITPDSGENSGALTVNVTGTNFQVGATLMLTRTGEPDIMAANVSVNSAISLTGDFDLTGAAVGAWNVVVVNPANQIGRLLDGFTVTAFNVATFTPGPSLNIARMDANPITLPDGRVVVFGGHGTGFIALDTAEVWQPGEASFTTLTMQYPHDWPAFAQLADGRLLLAGGAGDLGIPEYAAAEIYDPQDNSFTVVGEMERFRCMSGAATLSSGQALVAGAWWTHNDAHTYGELFSPATGTFAATGALDTRRAYPIVLPTNDGKGVVFGGCLVNGGYEVMPVELYDPATNTFSVLQDEILADDPGWVLSMHRRVVDAQQLADGRYLFLAQRIAQDVTSYRLFTFDPETRSLAAFPIMPALPDSTTYSFSVWQPVIDQTRGMAHLVGIAAESSPSELRLFSVDLATGILTHSANSYTLNPAYQVAFGADMTLLDDGRILLIGGSLSDNFDPVAYTLLITPHAPYPAPTVADISPDSGGALVYTDTQGTVLSVVAPSGSVTETVTLKHTSLVTVTQPAGFAFAGLAFNLDAYQGGLLLPGFTFLQPVTVTLIYEDSLVAGLDEETLTLSYWDRDADVWRDVAETCMPPSPYVRDLENNRLSAPICHLSSFGLFGIETSGHKIYLPLVLRQ